MSGPLIRQTFDPAFLNTVANDEAVRPGLSGAGVLDLSPLIATPDNVTLQTDCGGFVLTGDRFGTYEVHSLFLPGNGTTPIRAMRQALEWMFTRTDCVAIVSKVPCANKAAKGFAIAGGLRAVFERDDEALGRCEYVELPLMRWAMNCAALEAHGERFHGLLERAKIAAGSSLPVHAHDAAHERAVGAALLMIERGQAGKGVGFYNRWARLAGYQPIRLLSLSPVIVDAVDALVGLGENGAEVLLCR